MLFNTPKILHLKIIFSILFYAWHLQLFCARYFYVHFMYIIVSSRHCLIYFRINAVCIRHNILSVLFKKKRQRQKSLKIQTHNMKVLIFILVSVIVISQTQGNYAFFSKKFFFISKIRLLVITFTKCKCF